MREGIPIHLINIWGRRCGAFLAPGRSPRSFAASLCVCCIVHRIYRPSSSTHGIENSQKNSTVVSKWACSAFFKAIPRKIDHSTAHAPVHRFANTTTTPNSNNKNVPTKVGHTRLWWQHVPSCEIKVQRGATRKVARTLITASDPSDGSQVSGDNKNEDIISIYRVDYNMRRVCIYLQRK